MSVSDRIHTSLVSYGGSTIDERVYNYLGSLGLTGTISDRLAKYNHNGKKGWQAIIEGFGLSLSAGFVRQELFGESQQGVLYVSQPSYLGQQVLYQDAAGTTPVVDDGDPVGLMLDLSPNGNDASQSTSAARPLYRTDGALHWLEFDGVDDFLATSPVDFSIKDEVIYASAFKVASLQNSIVAELGAGGEDGSFYGFTSSSGLLRYNSRGTLPVNSDFSEGVTVGNSLIHFGESKISEDFIVQRKNGSQVSSETADQGSGSYGSSPLNVGMRNGSNLPLDGSIYGIIVRLGGSTGNEVARTENYLASLAGITL